MSIQGPEFKPIYRVESIDRDPADDRHGGNKKRQVLYQGRSWNKSERILQ